MNRNDDLIYYDRRARQERKHANTCQDNDVAQIHLHLANAYERRIEDASARIESNVVSIR